MDWQFCPCPLGFAQRFRAADKSRSGPQVGGLATPSLPSRGSPMLQCRGQNQMWPTSGQISFITRAVLVGPQQLNASDNIRSGPQVADGRFRPCLLGGRVDWLHHPCRLKGSPMFNARDNTKSGAQAGGCLQHPCRLGVPRCFNAGENIGLAISPLPFGGSPTLWAGGNIISGPQVGGWAISPLPFWGGPQRFSVGDNIKSGPQVGGSAT